MIKKYQLAKETSRYEYIRVMETTNCTDKRYGHTYEWIFKEHPEHDEIKKQLMGQAAWWNQYQGLGSELKGHA